LVVLLQELAAGMVGLRFRVLAAALEDILALAGTVQTRTEADALGLGVVAEVAAKVLCVMVQYQRLVVVLAYSGKAVTGLEDREDNAANRAAGAVVLVVALVGLVVRGAHLVVVVQLRHLVVPLLAPVQEALYA
jgi:hypothetical protein